MRSSVLACLVVSASCLIVTVSAGAAPNLVGNGGFEAGSAGWGAAAPNTIVSSTTAKKSGHASGLATRNTVTRDTNAGDFRLTLTAYGTYSLSYWLFVPTGYSGYGVVLNPEWVGVTGHGAGVNMHSRGRWQHVKGTFTLGAATSGALVLRLQGARTSDYVYIDDVTVRPAG